MARALLIAVMCSAGAFGGSITYNYTGTPFNDCTYGTCPSNYTSDYIVASATFAAPLVANLPLTNLTSSLTGWTIGDALGNFSYSSTTTPTYLTGYPSQSAAPFAVSTNGSGGIVAYDMLAFPAEVLGLTGKSEGGILNPGATASCPSGSCTYTGFVEINWGLASEWDAISFIPGTWTETLNGDQGGTTSAPVYLIGGSPVASLSGTISGIGAEDYYTFYWGGGAFSATATVTGASSGASYVFSAGVSGSCNSVGNETLNSGDGFSDAISAGNLAAGSYCIGINANSANDPNFSLTFNTPVSAAPEPSAFVLLSAGLGMIGVLRAKRGRQNS
jgi:hypothetical protein